MTREIMTEVTQGYIFAPTLHSLYKWFSCTIWSSSFPLLGRYLGTRDREAWT
jgi:uncharacterized membrane protein YdjX (TVP38/TMEM64 family)